METLAGVYNSADMRHLAVLQQQINEQLRENQKEHEIIRLYASVALGIAMAIRRVTEIDLCTASFPSGDPPFPETHPFMVVLKPLDGIIEASVKAIEAKSDGQTVRVENIARFQTGLIWKGFMFCLITPPSEWGSDDLCALGSLRILSSVSGIDLVDMLIKAPHAPIRHATPEQWPPPNFCKMYLANRDRIAPMAGWDLSRLPSP